MKRIALVLITSPSLSPENRHQFGTSIAAGPAMDLEILRDLFSNTRQRDVSLRKGQTYRLLERGNFPAPTR